MFYSHEFVAVKNVTSILSYERPKIIYLCNFFCIAALSKALLEILIFVNFVIKHFEITFQHCKSVDLENVTEKKPTIFILSNANFNSFFLFRLTLRKLEFCFVLLFFTYV